METSLVRCVLQIIFSQTVTCLFNFLTFFDEQKFNFEEADLSFFLTGLVCVCVLFKKMAQSQVRRINSTLLKTLRFWLFRLGF